MTCDLCTEPAIAVEPGCEGIHELFLLKRPTPRRQWCMAHWPALTTAAPARASPGLVLPIHAMPGRACRSMA